MKTSLLIVTMLCSTWCAYGQGTVLFANRIVNVISAPVWGPCTDPTIKLTGNFIPSDLHFPPDPSRYEVCGGVKIGGLHYSAQLWGASTGAPLDSLQPAGGTNGSSIITATFRTGSAAGLLITTTVQFNNLAPGESASLVMRVWDNRDGAITSWAQVLADPTVLRGESEVFDLPILGGIRGDGTAVETPAMRGLKSFNLYIVPEPATLGLVLLGMAALALRRAVSSLSSR